MLTWWWINYFTALTVLSPAQCQRSLCLVTSGECAAQSPAASFSAPAASTQNIQVNLAERFRPSSQSSLLCPARNRRQDCGGCENHLRRAAAAATASGGGGCILSEILPVQYFIINYDQGQVF